MLLDDDKRLVIIKDWGWGIPKGERCLKCQKPAGYIVGVVCSDCASNDMATLVSNLENHPACATHRNVYACFTCAWNLRAFTDKKKVVWIEDSKPVQEEV
jgi:hypothetical protein